jgi:hypothetical protein
MIAPITGTIDAAEIKWLRLAIQVTNHCKIGSSLLVIAKQEGEVMGARQAEGHNLQVGLDQLHSDPVRNNRVPYWGVDQSANHDEDRRVMKGRKAAPFVSTYKDQIT